MKTYCAPFSLRDQVLRIKAYDKTDIMEILFELRWTPARQKRALDLEEERPRLLVEPAHDPISEVMVYDAPVATFFGGNPAPGLPVITEKEKRVMAANERLREDNVALKRIVCQHAETVESLQEDAKNSMKKELGPSGDQKIKESNGKGYSQQE